MIRNLEYIRGLASKEFPDMGAKLYEALIDLVNQQGATSQQTNSNPMGQPSSPPDINGLKVTAQNGHFSAQIIDNNMIYRGINYWLEHADNANFTNPQIIDLGQTRNISLFLGNVTRYWRAYSSYASSPPSRPAYHGGAASPQPVTGGGDIGGPVFQDSQGSGTGAAGVGLSGPGLAPFRSQNGAAPTR